MVTFARVLLWTVVLVAPGGFLLVPVLAAHSLSARSDGSRSPLTLRERLTQLVGQARQALSGLQRHWTKS
jgi:hypothetical protein